MVSMTYPEVKNTFPHVQNKITKADCAVIGAGPAGLAASIQAVRCGLSIAVFERAKIGGQANAANWIENFPGFPKGISGRDLMQLFMEQALSYGIKIHKEEIKHIKSLSNGFALKSDCHNFFARTVIIAAGLKPKTLDLPGEESLAGRYVFSYEDPKHIPHKQKNVIVIGDGDAAFDQALHYSHKAKKVSIAMKHNSPQCAAILAERAKKAGINILPRHIAKSLNHKNNSATILFECPKKTKNVFVDIIVICVGKKQSIDFMPSEIQKSKGVFWAGDCRLGHMGHIAIACGDGIKAAIDAAGYINGNNLTTR